MKKISKFFLGVASLMLMTACSDDLGKEMGNQPGADNSDDVSDGVFFTVNINLPSAVGGRSITGDPDDNGSNSNNGHEIGKNYENIITEAIVVLAKKDNNDFIAAASINAGDLMINSADKSKYTAKSKFSKTRVEAFYDALPADRPSGPVTVRVFLFCNPTQELRNIFFADADGNVIETEGVKWYNRIGNLDTSSPIWSQNYFLMSNALIAERDLPATKELWSNYTKESTPFHLSDNNIETTVDNSVDSGRGAIKVERLAARFDFRDGANDGAGAFTYHVVYEDANIDIDEETESVADKIPLIDVTLQKMALVNVGRQFYFLPHVIDGVAGGAIGTIDETSLLSGLCKPEKPWFTDLSGKLAGTPGNYVLDADYSWKTVNGPLNNKYEDYLLYPLFDKNGNIDNTNISNDRWATSLCSDVVNGEENNTEGWTLDTPKDYHIWRYATENTIPSVEGQTNGVTTGVVFKGKMKATEQALNNDDPAIKAMAETINNEDADLGNSWTAPIIYQFAGGLYMTWKNVRLAAINAAQPKMVFVPAEDFETTGKGTWRLEEINRTHSLYVAVFGTGGFGTYKFNATVKKPDGTETTEAVEYTDLLPENEECANAAWTAWEKADKPSEGDVLTKFKTTVTKAGFTIYQRSYDPNYKWGYYCYYYYWNQHNNNGNDGVMGPMEFAVVRNNVYKLAVTKIKRLGHPRISDNDPERPEPGYKDESENVYIDVEAYVLPWVVRVNNIEF